MNLTPKLAQRVADQYSGPNLDRALADVMRRHGGLCGALSAEARRDLILTLGDHHRDRMARNASNRVRYSQAAE